MPPFVVACYGATFLRRRTGMLVVVASCWGRMKGVVVGFVGGCHLPFSAAALGDLEGTRAVANCRLFVSKNKPKRFLERAWSCAIFLRGAEARDKSHVFHDRRVYRVVFNEIG